MHEIVLIDTETHHVELYHRLETGQWLLTDIVDGEMELESIGRRLPLTVIYEKVDALPLDD